LSSKESNGSAQEGQARVNPNFDIRNPSIRKPTEDYRPFFEQNVWDSHDSLSSKESNGSAQDGW
jgi:hypothetical protein